MTDMTREQMIDMLQERVAMVIFTKRDGSQRTMRATLNSQLLPEHPQSSGSSRAVNLDAIRVYDLDAEGWRSFRVDSVISFI